MSASSPLPALVFYALAALTVGSAVAVTFSRNILRSAFWLLGTLGGAAGLYLTLGADFVGVTQVLVYVGGVLVLILFAVLLTTGLASLRGTNASVGRWVALAPAALLAAGLVAVAVTTPWRLTRAVPAPTTARVGDAFLREYLLPFELVSLLLLAALVGAIVLARRAARASARGGGSPP